MSKKWTLAVLIVAHSQPCFAVNPLKVAVGLSHWAAAVSGLVPTQHTALTPRQKALILLNDENPLQLATLWGNALDHAAITPKDEETPFGFFDHLDRSLGLPVSPRPRKTETAVVPSSISNTFVPGSTQTPILTSSATASTRPQEILHAFGNGRFPVTVQDGMNPEDPEVKRLVSQVIEITAIRIALNEDFERNPRKAMREAMSPWVRYSKDMGFVRGTVYISGTLIAQQLFSMRLAASYSKWDLDLSNFRVVYDPSYEYFKLGQEGPLPRLKDVPLGFYIGSYTAKENFRVILPHTQTLIALGTGNPIPNRVYSKKEYALPAAGLILDHGQKPSKSKTIRIIDEFLNEKPELQRVFTALVSAVKARQVDMQVIDEENPREIVERLAKAYSEVDRALFKRPVIILVSTESEGYPVMSLDSLPKFLEEGKPGNYTFVSCPPSVVPSAVLDKLMEISTLPAFMTTSNTGFLKLNAFLGAFSIQSKAEFPNEVLVGLLGEMLKDTFEEVYQTRIVPQWLAVPDLLLEALAFFNR